jgi:hypothetical protein
LPINTALPSPQESLIHKAAPPARAELAVRVAAGVFAAMCLLLLVLSASLRADARGHGTHQQLGLPPCGWVVAFKKPCMTCGMTTAFAFVATGEVRRGFVVQPAGALLAVGVAGLFWVCLYVAATGSRVLEVGGTLLRPRWLLVFAGIILAAWAYKWAVWTG